MSIAARLTVSHRLGKLKDLGVILWQRQGKEIGYEPAEGRVRCEGRMTDASLSRSSARGRGVGDVGGWRLRP
jgi:hypothetical protein